MSSSTSNGFRNISQVAEAAVFSKRRSEAFGIRESICYTPSSPNDSNTFTNSRRNAAHQLSDGKTLAIYQMQRKEEQKRRGYFKRNTLFTEEMIQNLGSSVK
jgi:hypothetical protein